MPVIEKTQLMSATEIDRTVQRLAHEIVEKSGGTKNLALIGIRRRGVPLALRIAHAMRGIDGVQVPVGTLDITLYRDDLSKVAPQPVVHSSEISFSVDDKDLILVDDVLYTGRTVRAGMNGLFDLGRPVRVRLCVLIDRGHRQLPIEASFVGRRGETSGDQIIEVRLNEVDQQERVMLMELVALSSNRPGIGLGRRTEELSDGTPATAAGHRVFDARADNFFIGPGEAFSGNSAASSQKTGHPPRQDRGAGFL